MQTRLEILQFLVGRLGAWLAAVGTAYVLAVATATQSVAFRLEAMGIPVPLAERLSMGLRDVAGMAPMFLPMIAFALLAAFLCAALLRRWLRNIDTLLYFVGGACAVVAIHLGLHLAFGITPIAVARTGLGLAAQGLAGGTGSLVYLLLARRADSATS